MEKVNKRALQMVTNDYDSTYNEPLSKAKVSSLYIERVKCIALETFKSLKALNPSFLHDMFVANTAPYNLRESNKLSLPKVNTQKYGINSLKFQGAKIWNGLPEELKNSNDVNEFKSKLCMWSGPTCACNCCILCKIMSL